MKTLIIGDIHGCYIELQELLARSGIADSDEVIALGDIVDRGPETPQVLDFFRRQPNARSLMGNHERKHVRAARGEVKLALSQIITRDQTDQTYHDAILFMNTFPIWIEMPEVILVHGCLEPGIPLGEQFATVLCGTMSGEKYLRSKYDCTWYELYKGDKPVIVGHYDYQKNGQPFVYQERVFGLDTSCVHGKTLTGLILPDFTIVSVPSRGNHWSAILLQYRQQHPVTRPSKSKAISVVSTDWDEESERLLQQILDQVTQENEQVLARLREMNDFECLTPRQQAKVYMAEIGETPLATLMHLARKGELDLVRAHKVVKNPSQLSKIAKNIGLR